ncbi:MAG: hypothetical protein WAK84_14910 [Candidatus Cybelea sp.]|jgi:hypothetical protein
MDQLEEQMRPADSNTTFLVLAWLWVGIPLAWGIAVTIANATKLFV